MLTKKINNITFAQFQGFSAHKSTSMKLTLVKVRKSVHSISCWSSQTEKSPEIRNGNMMKSTMFKKYSVIHS